MWLCPKCQTPALFSNRDGPWPENWVCSECGFIAPRKQGIPCLAEEQADEFSSFDPNLYASLVGFEETSFWFVNRTRLITGLARRYFPSATNIFEIGCGSGNVLLALKSTFPSSVITGSDLYLNGLTIARKRVGSAAMLLQMDVGNIPAAEQFDLIGAFDVIEHIPDDWRALEQIRAALRTDGGVIITVPQHSWLWSPADVDARHQRRYRRGELEDKLEKTGFRILCSTSFNSLLLPLMIVSRILLTIRARHGTKPKALDEFTMPKWLNGALGLLLNLEVRLTIAGIRWPLGGSRFVAAVRA